MTEYSELNTIFYHHTQARLTCGMRVEIIQRRPGMVMEFTITPPKGTKIEDSAYIKDGILQVNMTTDSFLGLFELLNMITGRPKRKKFLGLF